MTIEWYDDFIKVTRTVEPTHSAHVMSIAELAVLKLLDGRQLKANHPITTLNPQEWFTATEVKIEADAVRVRGPYTCWWNLAQVSIRNLDAERLE